MGAWAGSGQLGHRQKKGTQFSCGSEPAAAFSSGPGGGFYSFVSFVMPGFSFGVCARVMRLFFETLRSDWDDIDRKRILAVPRNCFDTSQN